MRAPRPLLLVVALLLAVFGTLGQAADLVDSMRAHAVCPAHGEIVHVEGAPSMGALEIRNHAPDLHDAGCTLAALGATSSAPLPEPPVVVLSAESWALPPARAPPARAVLSAVPLLSRAPKTSPPAA